MKSHVRKNLNCFLKDFIYLFLEKGRAEERERNIHRLPLTRPNRGPGLQPRHVP